MVTFKVTIELHKLCGALKLIMGYRRDGMTLNLEFGEKEMKFPVRYQRLKNVVFAHCSGKDAITDFCLPVLHIRYQSGYEITHPSTDKLVKTSRECHSGMTLFCWNSNEIITGRHKKLIFC